MKRASTMLILLILASVRPGSAQQAAAGKTESAKPIAALSWLVGGVWTADASKMGGGMLRIETRYHWADNNAYLRFNTHFVTDKGTLNNYDGNLFWNPTQKALAIWYMDRGNSIIEGPIQMDGDSFNVTFRGYDFDGKMADLRVDVTRKGGDHYHWAVAEKQPAGWKELAGLEYLRVAGETSDNASAIHSVLDAQVAAWNRGDLAWGS